MAVSPEWNGIAEILP